jgi:uncharacterized protein (TIGR02118 family)
VIKLFVFLRRRTGITREEFGRVWYEEHAPLALEAPGFRRRVRRYVQNHALPDASVPGLTLSSYDGVAELWFDGVDDVRAALADPESERVEAGVQRFVDTTSALRLVAEESVQFDRGFGSVKFIGLSRRHPSMSHDEWRRYWIEVHGPLAHGIPAFTQYYGRYVHNYVLPGDDGQEPAYDGIVEEWLESVDAFARCLSEPAYLEQVRPDELAFVDFARSHLLLAEERLIYEPGG